MSGRTHIVPIAALSTALLCGCATAPGTGGSDTCRLPEERAVASETPTPEAVVGCPDAQPETRRAESELKHERMRRIASEPEAPANGLEARRREGYETAIKRLQQERDRLEQAIRRLDNMPVPGKRTYEP